MVNDKISDLINRIKISSLSGKESVKVPCYKMTIAILEALKKEKYIEDYIVTGKEPKKEISIKLKYENGEPAVHDVKRISRTSNRVYKPKSDIRPVRSGYGAIVVSTSKGVMSGNTARKENVGGEALFEIW